MPNSREKVAESHAKSISIDGMLHEVTSIDRQQDQLKSEISKRENQFKTNSFHSKDSKDYKSMVKDSIN